MNASAREFSGHVTGILRRLLVATSIAIAAVSPAASAASADVVGLVIDVQGQITRVTAAGTSSRLEPLTYLEANDVVRLAKDARAVISLHASSEKWILAGPSEARAEAKQIARISGAAPTRQSLNSAQAQVLQRNMEFAQTAISMKGSTPVAGDPSGADRGMLEPGAGEAFLSGPVRVTWSDAADKPARVLVKNSAGEIVLSRENATSPTLLGSLAEGDYSVEVDGMVRKFSMLAAAERKRILALKPARNSAEDWICYALALEQAGAQGAAREAWKKVAELRPDFQEISRRAAP